MSKIYGIEIDKKLPSGEFFADLRLPEGRQPLPGGPQSKFDLLVWLGQMPDTKLLSNKLIKIVGEHVFDILYQAADYKSLISALQKHREKKEPIDSDEQQSLWHCWRLLGKLRALQEIDYLFNQPSFDVKALNQRVKAATEALAKLYPSNPFSLFSKNADEVREAREYQELQRKLAKLKVRLSGKNSTASRNAYLQNWQQNTFRALLRNFKEQQGVLSAIKHDFLPRENWENTDITREAEYCLEKWRFSEVGTITNAMLFRNDPGEVLHSATYPGVNKKNLLFATTMSEKLGYHLNISTNDSASMKGLNSKMLGRFRLYEARNQFDLFKKQITKKCVELKKETRLLEKAGKLPKPVTLKNQTRLFMDWWDLWSTSNASFKDLGQALKDLKTVATTPPTMKREKEEVSETGHKEPKTMAEGLEKGLFSRTRPAETAFVFSSGDVLTSALDFFNDLTGYFFQMMDKHPFVSTAAFTIPYLQFGGTALSITGNNTLAGFAKFFATWESKILAGKVSPEQITSAVKMIDEGILWFTSAESPLQVILTCGFTFSKVSYTIVDLTVNRLLSKMDESTFRELATKLDSTATLEGYTPEEKVKSYLRTGLSTAFLLAVSGAIGVSADAAHSAIIEFLAHIPLELITKPSIQTLGALKASGLLIGKLAGINNYISKEKLVDTQGQRLTVKSPSYQTLVLFAQLSAGHKKLAEGEQKSPAYQKVRCQFEKLLNVNPALLSFYKVEELKKLGVTARTTSWYKRFGMACLKSAFYALLFLPAIFAHAAYALAKKPVPPMLKLSLFVPLNWLVLTGMLFWSAAKTMFHGFCQVTLRLPEVAAQLAFVALRATLAKVGQLLGLAGAYLLKGLGLMAGAKICSKPSETPVVKCFTAIDKALKKAQVAVVSWVRLEIRYPVEEASSAMLKKVRDVFVRKPEQWLQRALVPAPQKETDELPGLSATATAQKVFEELGGKKSAEASPSTKKPEPAAGLSFAKIAANFYRPAVLKPDNKASVKKDGPAPGLSAAAV